MKRPTPEQIQDIASRLEGSCTDSPEQLAEEMGIEFTEEDLSELYGYVDICAECGWWSAVDEMGLSQGAELWCHECLADEEA